MRPVILTCALTVGILFLRARACPGPSCARKTRVLGAAPTMTKPALRIARSDRVSSDTPDRGGRTARSVTTTDTAHVHAWRQPPPAIGGPPTKIARTGG